MKRAIHPASLAAGGIAALAAGWLVLVAVSNGALNRLMVLHRDSLQPISAAQSAAVQAEAGSPRASPVSANASAGAGDFALVIPVSGIRPEQLTDTFSQARASGARRHDAIDIMAPLGTNVVAAASGQVEKLFLSRDGGNTIYVRSADRRTIYYYAHLDSYAPDLREGRMVGAGEVLGRVGYSGNGNPAAPHLHFAIWKVAPEIPWYGQGEPVNPYPLLKGA